MYPAAQSVHAEDPELVEYLPAGQIVHTALEVDPVNGFNVLLILIFFIKIKYYVIRSVFYFALKIKQELK